MDGQERRIRGLVKMMPFIGMNPKDEETIKRWFPQASEEQVKLIKEAVDNGLFDKELGLGYGFHVRKNTTLKVILHNDENNDEEVTFQVPYEITLPYYAAPEPTYSGDVELVPNAATYGNKLLTAIARGIVLPNFHTWEFKLNARSFTNLVTIAHQDVEGSDVYPIMVLDATSPVIYHVPYLLEPVVRLANKRFKERGVPYFALDEAFDLVLREVLSKYPTLRALEGEDRLVFLVRLLDVFSYQVAGAVLAGLVEPGPIVFTGYSEEWFDDDVRGVIDWLWTFYRFPRPVSWEEVPFKPVEDLFGDVAIAGVDDAETFRRTVMFNVEVGSELRINNRRDWSFIIKQIPEFRLWLNKENENNDTKQSK